MEIVPDERRGIAELDGEGEVASGIVLQRVGANALDVIDIANAEIDAAIVMIENAHKHLERAEPGTPRVEVLIKAASEAGPALFFSLLIITVSFLPIFALEGQEGRLFGPLAATKTFAMAAAALLSVTLVPALMVILLRGRIVPEHRNPVNRALIAMYRAVIQWVLRARVFTMGPALDGGTMMYMPTTLPGLSVTKAAELTQMQADRNLIVMLSLPFALVGGVWRMSWVGFDLSAAVAVGASALRQIVARFPKTDQRAVRRRRVLRVVGDHQGGNAPLADVAKGKAAHLGPQGGV